MKKVGLGGLVLSFSLAGPKEPMPGMKREKLLASTRAQEHNLNFPIADKNQWNEWRGAIGLDQVG